MKNVSILLQTIVQNPPFLPTGCKNTLVPAGTARQAAEVLATQNLKLFSKKRLGTPPFRAPPRSSAGGIPSHAGLKTNLCRHTL